MDVLLVVLAVEVEQLGDQEVGRVGRDRAAVAAEEDDALLSRREKMSVLAAEPPVQRSMIVGRIPGINRG